MGRGGADGADGGVPGALGGGGGGIQYVKFEGSAALLPMRDFTWCPCAAQDKRRRVVRPATQC